MRDRKTERQNGRERRKQEDRIEEIVTSQKRHVLTARHTYRQIHIDSHRHTHTHTDVQEHDQQRQILLAR